MRFAVILAGCAVLAGCGGNGSRALLTLRSTEAAVRSAGYSRLRVLNASIAIAQLRAGGFGEAGLREGTPDYVIPRAVPVVYVLRFESVERAKRMHDRSDTARVCNVVVYNAAPRVKIAERAAHRIVSQLTRRCR